MQTLIPDSLVAIEEIVRAEGNLALAAEWLHITPAVLLGVIASDPMSLETLSSQLRIATAIKVFESLFVLHDAMKISMSDLKPRDMTKTYAEFAKLLTELTDSHTSTQNVNVTELVMRMLPPQAREALLQLTETKEE